MRRTLAAVVVTLALLISSPASAGEFSFGVSLQSQTRARFFPIPVAQLGYDFGSASEGFCLETVLAPWLLVNTFAVQAYYRVPVSPEGGNLYVGAGALALIWLLPGPDGAGGGNTYGYGLVGWEAPLNADYTYFLEVAPGVDPTRGGFLLRFSLGLRAHRTEFPTRF